MDPTPTEPSATPDSRVLPIAFTASGSEYFRIWIVNLLLIGVTLGFYIPFAKARRLRYFYANTLVDHQPLAFHGDPWKMFRGYLVMLVIFGVYAAVARVSDWATLGAFGVLAAIWPALWRSSLMFRLSNTSWRGLRFGFVGSLAGAYQAVLPLFVPGLLILLATAWGLSGVDQTNDRAMAEASQRLVPLMGLAIVVGLVMLPWALWRMRRYQHNGYRHARERTRFALGAWPFYRISLKAALLAVVCVAVMVLLLLAVGMLVGGAVGGKSAAVLIVTLVVGFGYLVLFALVGSASAAWMQNLSWGATRSDALRFHSQLSPWGLARMTLANVLLTIVTLGLYRPFAVVRTTRLRLQAMAVVAEGDIDAWQADPTAVAGSGSGEMSGDFFGIDVGL